MSTLADCLFCQFATDNSPVQLVGHNQRAVAFMDINPQAPVHALVIPRQHHNDVAALAAADPAALADMVALAKQVASELSNGQFRLVFNSGPMAGQSVFHVHGHVLTGAKLGWTPA